MSLERARGQMERLLGITQARDELSRIIERVQHQGDSYIISRHGKAAAAVVPLRVYQNWKRKREELFESIRQFQTANEDAEPEQVMEDVLQAQQAARSSG